MAISKFGPFFPKLGEHFPVGNGVVFEIRDAGDDFAVRVATSFNGKLVNAYYPELPLPRGWFYEFQPGSNGSHLHLWNAGGNEEVVKVDDNKAVAEAYGGRVLRADFGDGTPRYIVSGANGTGPVFHVHPDGPNPDEVFPTTVLFFGSIDKEEQLPYAVCRSHWLSALELNRTHLSKSGKDKWQARLGFPNGAEMQNNITMGKERLTNPEDTSKTGRIGVWPIQLRPKWQLHRLIAELMVGGKFSDKGQLKLSAMLRVRSESGAERLVPTDRLDKDKKASFESNDNMLNDDRSAILLPDLDDGRWLRHGLDWAIEFVTTDGDGVMAGLFGSKVFAQDVVQGANVQVQVGLDLGTTTTVAAIASGNESKPFRIGYKSSSEGSGLFPATGRARRPNLDSPELWTVGWTPVVPPEDRKSQNPWLPWVPHERTKQTSSIEQFATSALYALPRAGAGDVLNGQWSGSLQTGQALSSHEDLPNDKDKLKQEVWYKTLDGAIKWKANKSSAYENAREAFLEQLILFVANAVNGAGNVQDIMLSATAPGAFNDNARSGYADCLYNVVTRLSNYTGINIALEEKTGQGFFRDEVEPVLFEAVKSAGVDSNLPHAVLVADLGGGTFDVGLYVYPRTNTMITSVSTTPASKLRGTARFVVRRA